MKKDKHLIGHLWPDGYFCCLACPIDIDYRNFNKECYIKDKPVFEDTKGTFKCAECNSTFKNR